MLFGYTLPTIDWQALRFGQPDYLWLLAGPAVLLVVWTWQLIRRRGDIRRYARHRAVPDLVPRCYHEDPQEHGQG